MTWMVLEMRDGRRIAGETDATMADLNAKKFIEVRIPNGPCPMVSLASVSSVMVVSEDVAKRVAKRQNWVPAGAEAGYDLEPF